MDKPKFKFNQVVKVSNPKLSLTIVGLVIGIKVTEHESNGEKIETFAYLLSGGRDSWFYEHALTYLTDESF